MHGCMEVKSEMSPAKSFLGWLSVASRSYWCRNERRKRTKCGSSNECGYSTAVRNLLEVARLRGLAALRCCQLDRH
jgi:hypothetical protein